MNIVTEKELAERLKVSVPKLRLDRYRKKGVPYYRIGGSKGSIRYNLEQVLKHLEDSQLQK
jgi:hypothetical protein|tara:strand:- start:423 stop:605 length:183 start_codon:yes stop_codon:yes gene_type:complete